MKSVRKHYKETEFNEEVILYKYDNEDEVIDYMRDWIDVGKKCAFLNFRNDIAEMWSSRLNSVGIPFVYIPSSPLDYANLESEHIWIARSIAQYIFQLKYSEYDFMDEIPMPESYRVSLLKKNLVAIKDALSDEILFIEKCLQLYQYLGYIEYTDKVEKEISKLYEVVNDDKFCPTYNQDSFKLTSGTIHSSKGLEFEQVVINAQDYNLSNEGMIYLHYVAISRPEERLLIIAKNSIFSRYKGYINTVISRTSELEITINMKNVVKIVEQEN